MKKIIFIALLMTSTMTFAEYTVKVPLEIKDGGFLSNGSIQKGSGSGSGSDTKGEAPVNWECNYAGQDGGSGISFNGYIYHHIEYRGEESQTTVWYNNIYIGEIYPRDLEANGYKMGNLVYTGSFSQYYEICRIMRN